MLYKNSQKMFLQELSCLYASTRVCTHHFHQKKRKKREGESETESNAVIRRNLIFHPALCVFQIILCRYVPVQFSLNMSTQLDLKSFIKYV